MKTAYAIIDPKGNILLNFIRNTPADCIALWGAIKKDWDDASKAGYKCQEIAIKKI